MPKARSAAFELAPLLDGSTAGELIPELVRHGLQQLTELEVAAVLVAGRHERSEERLGYRNGYRPRALTTLDLEQSWPHWRLLFIDGPSDHQHRKWLDQCCAAESRCRWLMQDPAEPGIFGAMNQGFAEAAFDDWLLFWGSDDWAAGPEVLAQVAAGLERAASQGTPPDLLVCRGRYVDAASCALSRPTVFQAAGLFSTAAYRRALWFGFTPPHQATLFGPGARRHLARYAPGFRLSADLDYFLQLSSHPGLRVQCLDLELVHMAEGGVSAQQTQRRLQEVRHAYRRAFAWRWWFPFVARYIRRLASLAAH